MNMVTLKIIDGILLLAFVLTSNVFVGVALAIAVLLSVSEKFGWTHMFHQKCAYKFSRNYF